MLPRKLSSERAALLAWSGRLPNSYPGVPTRMVRKYLLQEQLRDKSVHSNATRESVILRIVSTQPIDPQPIHKRVMSACQNADQNHSNRPRTSRT
jgi:hypothetical protein